MGLSALKSREERGGAMHPNALAFTRRWWWLGPAMLVALCLLVAAWFLPTMTVEKVPWIWSTKFSIWRVVGGLYADGQPVGFVLTSLYRNYSSTESSYPFFSAALQNVAFGPFMTMILRRPA